MERPLERRMSVIYITGYLERMFQAHLAAVCEDRCNLFKKFGHRQPFLFLWGGGMSGGLKRGNKVMVCICFLPDLTSQQKRDYL